jgi:hypothetical protein
MFCDAEFAKAPEFVVRIQLRAWRAAAQRVVFALEEVTG